MTKEGLEQERRTMLIITDVESTRKCANDQCQCQIPSTEKFCGDYCSEVGNMAEVELQCNCGHPACALA